MKRFLTAAILLWLSAALQPAVAPRFSIGAVTPDYLLVAMGCLALHMDRRAGTITGFAAGLLVGALAGANLGAYIVSRTVGGFLVGWFSTLEFDANPIVALVTVACTTLVVGVLFMFGAPPPQIGPFLLATIGSAMYNGVLAMPLFFVVKRVLDPPTR